MPDTPDTPTPGPHILVLRAAFVPEGQQPPPELSSDFSPLKFRATRDPVTGAITCDNLGINFDGDIRAEWHPDEEQDSEAGQETAGQGGDARDTGGQQDDSSDTPRDRTWALGDRPVGHTYSARSGGRTPFGLSGDGSGDDHGDGSPASPAGEPDQESESQDGDDATATPPNEADASAADANSDDDVQNDLIPPTEAEQQTGLPRGAGLVDEAAERASRSGASALATSETAEDADVAGDDGTDPPGESGRGDAPASSEASMANERLKPIDRTGRDASSKQDDPGRGRSATKQSGSP